MKHLLILILTFVASIPAFSQNISETIDPFDRIVASQFVNVVLEKGDQESVRIEYNGIDPEYVNVKVKRKKLQIYLTDARVVERKSKYHYNGNKMPVLNGEIDNFHSTFENKDEVKVFYLTDIIT